MRKHAEFLRPKFDVVLETLDRELTGLGAGKLDEADGRIFYII